MQPSDGNNLGNPSTLLPVKKSEVLSRISSLCYFPTQWLAVSVCPVGLLLELRGRNDLAPPLQRASPSSSSSSSYSSSVQSNPTPTTAASGLGLTVSHRRLFSVNLTFVRCPSSHLGQSSCGEVSQPTSEDSVDSSYFHIDVLCLFDQGSPSPRPAHLTANLNGHGLTCQPYLGWTDPLNHRRLDCTK